jgi:alkylhydroperoxidase family enzyme
MTPRPTSPRLAPLAEEELDAQGRELLGGAAVEGAPAANIFRTLVRHPGLFRRWLPFGGKLLAGKLPAHDREILILRTAWRCRCDYEWGQHVLIARSAGLTDETITQVSGDDEPDGLDPFDKALVQAADELHDDACLTDGTWSELAARYDQRQLIEVPMVVGHYHLLAFALNSLGVPLEPGVHGFGS